MSRSCVASLSLSIWLCAATAFAEEDPAFEKAKQGAVPADGGLSTFLSKFVGACDDDSGPDCKKAASEYRQKAKGKKMYLSVEDAAALLQLGKGGGDGEVLVAITPFFAAGEFALTSGSPKKTDSNGNPVMGLIRTSGKAPDGDVDRLGRMLTTRQLKVDVVFTPEGNWTLPKKGGGTIQGVSAKIHAVRVAMARTGETVALWTGR